MNRHIPVAPDRWAEMVQASADVGPLRNKVSDLSTQLELRQVEIDRLRSEVERLRKAGDAMAESIKFDDQRSWEDWGNQGKSLLRDCVIDWITAKRKDDA